MNILLTGASGFIGRHLITKLIDLGHDLTVCIHKTTLSYPVKVMKCDFTKQTAVKDWLSYLSSIEVVINCVGIITESKRNNFADIHVKAPIALFKACEEVGVKRVIHLSALGVGVQAKVAYQKSKKRADLALMQTALKWFVLRPSLVSGQGGKSHQLFKSLSRLPWVPLIDGGKQMIQPVNILTLLDVIEHCLHTRNANRIIDVVGKQAMTYQQWMQKLNPKRIVWRFITVPMWLVRPLAGILKLCGFQLMTPDNLTMLAQHNIADHRPLQRFMEQ